MKVTSRLLLSAVTATLALAVANVSAASDNGQRNDGNDQGNHGEGHFKAYKHVLLISVDGLHEVDVRNYISTHKNSTFQRLRDHGVYYQNASTSRPSDSFPGLTALVTGASPRSTGVYYDDSYDRTLAAYDDLNCTGPVGAETQYAENIDRSYDDGLGGSTRLDAGGGIDMNRLPRDKANHCSPVYPHQFLRVNTIFNVAHDAGLYTAWSDKHPAYELVRGRANTGAEDLYTPEINSPPHDLACTAAEGPGGNVDDNCAVLKADAQWTSDVNYTTVYDGLKVQAVINEIRGFDHTGKERMGVPAILGMNFQSVSVGQKLTADGYKDSAGTPSDGLAKALDFVDASLGRFVKAIREEGLYESTLIIVAAKHGQSPIDVSKLHMKKGSKNPKATADVTDVTDVLGGAGIGVAQATEDDVSLLWLTNQNDTANGVIALQANAAAARVDTIYSGATREFGDPTKDPRTPDLIVQPVAGTIYSKSSSKIAEHGGFAPDDTHSALILSNPHLGAATIDDKVTNQQVAPTILRALGLSAGKLDGVKLEGTRVLPGVGL
jgi:hypothetical protein